MLRRWRILLAMLALTAATALDASSASAATPTAGRLNPGGAVHLVGPRTHARGLQTEVGSTNWSGYAATTGTYTSVSASWTQPAGMCSWGDQYAAFWVGLDGYSSSTVEQTGSEVDCVGRTAQYYAWYEMYPGPSDNYANTVRAGDHFNASVTYEGSDQFSLVISDTTQGWTQTTTQILPGAARSSAEVIVEAPCCTVSGGSLALTDFGTMSFTGWMANGSANASDSRNSGVPTEIIMVANAARDKDTISSLSDGRNFSVTWLRST
jgi:Peptidase A4 family